ncbi:TetR/AcrR family transcriptional regulator [Amycolatopsis sp. H6(2020)]|nr:TetR/AcrR family transcriptional regulator [Amycolatopsis sp. H6(2020)]
MSTAAHASASSAHRVAAGPAADAADAVAPEPSLGTRAAQRQRKTAAIVEAATQLFRTRGYESVTTQQIADTAGVTNGAFFRHVGSKSDLLVRVVNDQLRTGHDRALASLEEGADPTQAILDLMVPLRDLSLEHPELATAYIREVVFARSTLTEGSLEQIDRMRFAIERILRHADAAADADRAGQRPADYCAFAADTVFSSICIELVRASLGRSDVLSLPERFRTMITRLVEMLLR